MEESCLLESEFISFLWHGLVVPSSLLELSPWHDPVDSLCSGRAFFFILLSFLYPFLQLHTRSAGASTAPGIVLVRLEAPDRTLTVA